MVIQRVERQFALLATVVMILLGEWMLIQRQFLSGLLVYSLLLLLLLLYVAYRWAQPQHYLLVLAIPCIIRLLNFTLPLGDLSPIFAQLIISFPLMLTGAVFLWLFKEAEFSFDLKFQRRQAPIYLLLIGLGSFAGFMLFQFQKSARLTWSSPLLLFFYAFVVVVAMACLEEWLFRGIMQTALSKLLGNGIAGLVVALVYTVLHVNQGSWLFVLLIFVFATGLSWLRLKSGGLLNVFLVHSAANILFFLILPLR